MTADVTYITSFRQLRLTDQLPGHFELLPGVNITNDPALKQRLLTPDYGRAAGVIELAHLQQANNVVFGELRESDMLGASAEPFLLAILIWIEGLFDNAWLLKDHAMRCEAAHLAHRTSAGTYWTSNFLATRPTFADGTLEGIVEMSSEDLRAWAETNERVESYLHEAKSSRISFMMEKAYARSGRAMRFVKAARAAPDMAFKVAHYCSALETLFTTDTAELSHKLAERAAFFLGDRGYHRIDVFQLVKKAYAIRSKLVHGDTLPARTIDELPDISSKVDEYLRVVLNAVFRSDELKLTFDSHSQAVEEYFIHLILNGKTPSRVEAEQEPSTGRAKDARQ